MEKNIIEIFAERLKDLRIEFGYSTTTLGKAIGVSAMAISRWERAIQIPNIVNLAALAKIFKVSTDYLCGLEN